MCVSPRVQRRLTGPFSRLTSQDARLEVWSLSLEPTAADERPPKRPDTGGHNPPLVPATLRPYMEYNHILFRVY